MSEIFVRNFSRNTLLPWQNIDTRSSNGLLRCLGHFPNRGGTTTAESKLIVYVYVVRCFIFCQFDDSRRGLLQCSLIRLDNRAPASAAELVLGDWLQFFRGKVFLGFCQLVKGFGLGLLRSIAHFPQGLLISPLNKCRRLGCIAHVVFLKTTTIPCLETNSIKLNQNLLWEWPTPEFASGWSFWAARAFDRGASEFRAPPLTILACTILAKTCLPSSFLIKSFYVDFAVNLPFQLRFCQLKNICEFMF